MAAPRAGLGKYPLLAAVSSPLRHPPPVAACLLLIRVVPFLDAPAQSIYSAPVRRVYARATPALPGQEPGAAAPLEALLIDEKRRFFTY